jgi:transposase
MRNEDVTSQQWGSHRPEQRPTLTIAEAAQVCGVSSSTIRRYLRAGRFSGARQAPSRVPGRPRQWQIPTEDVLGAGLDRQRPTPSRHAKEPQSAEEPAGAGAERDRVQALERALELERTRRQAAEVLAAERARMILTLETALQALEHRRPEPATGQTETAASASTLSGASTGQARKPAPQPEVLQMVPRPRRPARELSQEERAAIIGRALSRERPPKRRWRWW